MATNNSGDDAAAAGTVEFIQYHQPGLKDGLYRIEVTQEIRSNETGAVPKRLPADSFKAERTFFVSGERFSFAPALFAAVFPADGSLGEHSNVLPHVILTRSTLPWERSPLADEEGPERDDLPWLALLLFDDEEKPEPAVVTLDELLRPPGESGKFPPLTLETGQAETDKVTVIDVKKELLQAILPSAEALGLLAHVRQGKPEGVETAALICNRLPKKGASSTVHLVSLEGRFTFKAGEGEQGADATVPRFDFQGAADTDPVRLVSLKSWSFACADERQSFTGLLLNLNRQFSDPGVLRLPPSSDTEAEQFLASGFVPLPHFLRHSGRTVSWYHGPLIPGGNDARVELPARAADQLVRYDPRRGMFDVSYAAAWELGRLLALQSRQLSVSLYNWKRANAQQLKQAEQQLLHPHLPPLGRQAPPPATPADIVNWFADLSVLRGVPFNYLVPDERMLPAESVRFFRLDDLWVDCLLDGAFSVGRVTKTDFAQAVPLKGSLDGGGDPEGLTSGLLLRSAVVSGWPGLIVDAYDDAGERLDSRRTERLSGGVLLCIFRGDVRRAEFHQRPEMMHFGLDAAGDLFTKMPRNPKGEEVGPAIPSEAWLTPLTRVVNAESLASALREKTGGGEFTSAQFALQMIEGVKRVTLYAAGARPPKS